MIKLEYSGELREGTEWNQTLLASIRPSLRLSNLKLKQLEIRISKNCLFLLLRTSQSAAASFMSNSIGEIIANWASDAATKNAAYVVMRTLMFRGFVLPKISLLKMSYSESNSDLSCISDDDSEYNYIPGIYGSWFCNRKSEDNWERARCRRFKWLSFSEMKAFITIEEWLKGYERRRKLKKRKRLEGLTDRLSRI